MTSRMNILVAGLIIVCAGLSPLSFEKIAFANPPDSFALPLSANKDSLAQDSALQSKVEADFRAKSLSEILASLSKIGKVRLITSPSIGAQRMTLYSSSLSIYEAMELIACTLSHSVSGEQGYSWESQKVADSALPSYNLKRNLNAVRQEREARQYPKRGMRKLLSDFRDILNLPKSEWATYKTDLTRSVFDEKEPVFGVYHSVIRNLSNADIDALLRGESIIANREQVQEAVVQFNQKEAAAYKAFVERITSGKQPPPPPKPIQIKGNPSLRLTANTFSGDKPWREFEYAIRLDGVFDDQWMTLNPLEKPVAIEETQSEAEPTIDLTPIMTDKRVKASQRDGLAYILYAFSKAAKVNVCAEHFYKLNTLGVPTISLKPTEMKGTKAQLLKRICDRWEYQAEEKDGVYSLWSASWAFDKAADISESKVQRWRKILKKQGRFTSDDLIKIAQSYTWLQIAVSLPVLLENGSAFPDGEEFPPVYLKPLFSRTWYQALRLQGNLSPSELASAMTKEGITVRSLPSTTIAEVVRFVLIDHEEEKEEQQAELRQATLAGKLRLRRAEGYRFEQPLILEVVRGE